MVYLDADKQTYADLNVTGNVYGEQALCSLFLKAETKKGKSLMLDWIMHPLSDWEQFGNNSLSLQCSTLKYI